tara:strand:- start:660 stop:956 length:297 start_codon:yes stop_codon:yes gene_type:complete
MNNETIHSEIQLKPETFQGRDEMITRSYAERVTTTLLWDGVKTDGGTDIDGSVLIYHGAFPELGIEVKTALGAKRAINKIRKQAASMLSTGSFGPTYR